MHLRLLFTGIAILLFFAGLTLTQTGVDLTYAAIAHQGATFGCTTVSEIPGPECQALVELYQSTDGPNWLNRDGWLQNSTPCAWYGVGCNSEGHVSQLFLDQNQLVGPLPPAIGNLTQLTWLQLNNNQLSGTIPPDLGTLTQVTWLRLEENALSGAIPPALGGMTLLESLYLSDNQLTGSIPPELGNLPNLIKLNLAFLPLSGPIPPELGNLSTLETISLNNTQLSGPLLATFVNLANVNFFHFLQTDLCEPNDAPFQAWLAGITSLFSPEISCSASATTTPVPPVDDTATPTVNPLATTVTNTVTTTAAPTATPTGTPTVMPTDAPMPGNATNLCTGLITDQAPHPMTFLAKPGLLESVIDPAFGTIIRRITDIEASVTGEQAVLKPMYNTIQAWNADESRLILYQRGEGHQLYNGLTYEFIRSLDIRPADLEEVFWHFSDPDILFYVEPNYVNNDTPGQRLIRYRVSSDTREVVRSFANVCARNEGVVGGNDVQMMSWDSDVIGLRCVNEPARFFGYRISTDTVTPFITSGADNEYLPWYAPQPAPQWQPLFS